MTQIIFETIYLFLPAMAANLTPVFAARYNWLAFLNRPLDGGLTWHNGAILGANKTWRGLLIGVAAAALTGWAQGHVYLGAGLGLGALAGDAVKSFFKRRAGIVSGQNWRPWDQIDFVLGAMAASLLFSPLTFTHYALAIIIIGFGSYLVSYAGVKLGVKKEI